MLGNSESHWPDCLSKTTGSRPPSRPARSNRRCRGRAASSGPSSASPPGSAAGASPAPWERRRSSTPRRPPRPSRNPSRISPAAPPFPCARNLVRGGGRRKVGGGGWWVELWLLAGCIYGGGDRIRTRELHERDRKRSLEIKPVVTIVGSNPTSLEPCRANVSAQKLSLASDLGCV